MPEISGHTRIASPIRGSMPWTSAVRDGVSGGGRVSWKVMVTTELGTGHPHRLWITDADALNLAHLGACDLQRPEQGRLGWRRGLQAIGRRVPIDDRQGR
jgi:hypothetical protein